MTATLEELYHLMPDDGVSPEYEAARAAKVVEIAEYITPRIKHGVDPYRLAEQIVSDAEEQGRIVGDEVYGEVPSRYTKSGNPIAL